MSVWGRIALFFIVLVWIYGAIGLITELLTPACRRIRFEIRDRKRRRRLRQHFAAKYLR